MKREKKFTSDKMAERWFSENGFAYKYIHMYPSKTIFEITKDGFTYEVGIPKESRSHFKKYMTIVKDNFELNKRNAFK